ncbi:NAD(P)H-dependent oxidoreductase [Sinimarinibacterium sp. NLF-5-8]|uniref:NAD(P)H-dependent oxidoreductase n=1 Tax=Sinimarinibacterium sp. NLF-5-8 TaxID=2698684 RepID=UPI00137BAD50|nr:NAD(P)H-dependent oxidoreductase [Sinimarinibacterium sp. NLF-5-8]QHS09292.1 NAD(P)H-dependent oxidoreductase [Sinimarinibacterium sp. NLF-5-8]
MATEPKNITVILGHPDTSSFCGSIAEKYVASAKAAGHSVRLFRLGEIAFDPVLRHGYQRRQELEPSLVEIRDAISWAQHLVFIYPIWWGSIPAILKGMFDRIFLPGYAFKYRKDSPWWDRLLSGRSAHSIVTMDTPPWYYRLIYTMPGHHQMKKTILEFCGIKPVRITSFGPVRQASEAQLSKWLRKVERLAAYA